MGKDNIAMGVPIENLVEGEGRKWEDLVEEGKRQCSNCSSSFSSSSRGWFPRRTYSPTRSTETKSVSMSASSQKKCMIIRWSWDE
mmetsp:Transcript_30557/g.51695  ORF Transcript_30557/g.51695 Transcript_30557/m.51695 type:complete len:85 (+) Transcript_30557:2072-2326(+)